MQQCVTQYGWFSVSSECCHSLHVARRARSHTHQLPPVPSSTLSPAEIPERRCVAPAVSYRRCGGWNCIPICSLVEFVLFVTAPAGEHSLIHSVAETPKRVPKTPRLRRCSAKTLSTIHNCLHYHFPILVLFTRPVRVCCPRASTVPCGRD